MSVIDIVNSILSAGYTPSDFGEKGLLIALPACAILSIYIFFCYRIIGRRTFFSMNYALSLLAAAPVTCALILLMHQHAIASIEVIGALSIVRLRGAVKEPMDLAFLLWAVACGIFIASGMWWVGITVSIAMTAAAIFLDLLPLGRAPLILSVYGYEGEKTDLRKVCSQAISRSCSGVKEISCGNLEGRQNLVLRVNTSKRLRLTNELAGLPEVESVTLLEQTGEVSF